MSQGCWLAWSPWEPRWRRSGLPRPACSDAWRPRCRARPGAVNLPPSEPGPRAWFLVTAGCSGCLADVRHRQLIPRRPDAMGVQVGSMVVQVGFAGRLHKLPWPRIARYVRFKHTFLQVNGPNGPARNRSALQINLGTIAYGAMWGYGVDPPSDTLFSQISSTISRSSRVRDTALILRTSCASPTSAANRLAARFWSPSITWP
jgi:hypothetical protein